MLEHHRAYAELPNLERPGSYARCLEGIEKQMADLAKLTAINSDRHEDADMTYLFEMTQRMQSREIVTRSNEIWALLHEAAVALGPRAGGVGGPDLSGARGEIEIGIDGGPQIKIRVVGNQ